MYNLLVPKKSFKPEQKQGGGDIFCASYWNKVGKNKDSYKEKYNNRIKKIQNEINEIEIDKKSDFDKKYYFSIKYDEMVTSKSTEPSKMLENSHLQVVESKNDGTFIIGGRMKDIKDFKNILEKVSFEKASTLDAKNDNEISREVYSIASINVKLIGSIRLSKDVEDFINSSNDENIERTFILDVYSDKTKTEYDCLFQIINNKFNEKINKVDSTIFISNVYFEARLSKKNIIDLLNDNELNFISFIDFVSKFEPQRCIPKDDFKNITITGPVTDEKVVLIDGEVYNGKLKKFVCQEKNCIKSGAISNIEHGTMVASRILFGDKIFNKKLLEASCYIINVKFLEQSTVGTTPVGYLSENEIDWQFLMKTIKESVETFSKEATIFNLSIASEKSIDERYISHITELIDHLSNKFDVLFICACGNNMGNLSLDYKDLFNPSNCFNKIASPSDAINALTVGSITTEASDKYSICEESGFPSPFTRAGGIRNNYKKPELVHFGGNIKKPSSKQEFTTLEIQASNYKYGVDVINSQDSYFRDIGTSFSAPVISMQAARLLNYLKKTDINKYLQNFDKNKANLVKALLIHSTSRVKQNANINDDEKLAYGFGIPNYEKVLKDDENQITFLYSGNIKQPNSKQKLSIELPKNLKGKKADFILTFVYNPPVNKNFVSNYKMITLEPSIRFLRQEKKPLSQNPKSCWDDYRNPDFNTYHFTKKRETITELELEIIVTMTLTKEYEDLNKKRLENISQNYALILTVVNRDGDGTLRKEIMESNQFFEINEVENIIDIVNEESW